MGNEVDKLPYELTKGVTATREGLQFRSPLMVTVEYFPYDINALDEPLIIPWPDVVKRLRYREGEPWCRTEHGIIECWSGENNLDDTLILHRLAAILCDDAEAFRVLHWCIKNLGE